MQFLPETDPQITALIEHEKQRQESTLMLIPSENHASKAVEEAVGSSLGNKYAEGYPNKRYYQGNEYVDQIEQLAIDRAQELFKVPFANVQAYSGSPANSAIYFATLKQGDTLMGLALPHGGHLTHGHPKVTFSGTYFNSVPYHVREDGWIDYDELEKQVKKVKPQALVAGTTAYPRILDFERFAQIADSVGALLIADISHISGLVVTDQHPSPVPHAHIVMTTTHKTLRAARGALILVTNKGLKRDPKLGEKINKAIIPGLQGGPHLNNIAGIAVGLLEASSKDFKAYGKQIVANAKALAKELMKHKVTLVTDGTDNHLMVADIRDTGMSGREAAILLEKAGFVLNANTIPYDPNPPYKPSGIRLGTPAITSRRMKQKEMQLIGQVMAKVLHKQTTSDEALEIVHKLCKQFPVPERY